MTVTGIVRHDDLPSGHGEGRDDHFTVHGPSAQWVPGMMAGLIKLAADPVGSAAGWSAFGVDLDQCAAVRRAALSAREPFRDG